MELKSNGNKPTLTFYDAPDKKRLHFAIEDFCVLTEIVGTIYAATGGDYKERPFLDALIGISKGRLDWTNRTAQSFRASYETLVDQVKPFDHNQEARGKKSDLQTIKRMSGRSRKDQDVLGIEWFKQVAGTMDSETGEHSSSEFTLPILEYALEACHRARSNPERYEGMGPEKKWMRAALEVVSEISRNKAEAPKPKGKQSTYQAEQQTLGMLLRLGSLKMESGADSKAATDAIKHIAGGAAREIIARQDEVDPLYAASPEGQLDAAAAFEEFHDELEADFNDLDELETGFDTLEVNQI
jgi:hypothetical protein